MKTTSGHLFKRGNSYCVFWRFKGKAFKKTLRDESGSAITTLRDESGSAITTLREAEKAKDRLMAPFAAGNEADALASLTGKLEACRTELVKIEEEKNPPLAISQAWSAFIASPNRPDTGDSTMRQYEFQWQAFEDWMSEKHPAIRQIRETTRAIAEEYAGSLNHGRLSPSTYNKHMNLLALVFRTVKDKAKLTVNHWESPKRGGFIQRKRASAANSRRELTIDELRTICQSAAGDMRVLLALGVYTGLRLGDCATLRWTEVDLHRNLIRRIPNKTARRNPKPVIVPLHAVLSEMLLETKPENRGEYVLPEIAAQYSQRTDLVTDRVQSHFKKCGIKLYKTETGKAGKRAILEVGFHSLRHTFVSLCRESNAPLAVVESIVGHSSPAMTRHYTHVGEIAAGRAVSMLPSVISAKPVSKQQGIMEDLNTLVKSLTAENWLEKKEALLKLLASNKTN